MPNSKTILKFFFALGVWSFPVIGLFRIHGQNVMLQEHPPAPLSGRLLLQKENRYFEATSTTTDRIDDVLIDNRQGMDDESLVKDVASRIPSLPIAYWSKYKNVSQKKSSTCAKYPSIFELEFNNIYWQTLRTSNGTFQLFGAYYDIRKSSLIGPSVRILGMIDRIEPKVKTYCQFWFDGQKEPHIVKTFEYKYIWYNKWGNYKQGIYQPYLIACQIPKPFHSVVPASVSIVEKECDTATNNLRVIYNRPPDDKKKGFAVCVKGLDFLYDDLSVRLVEWIEMLRILGAEKIYFYELQVHPNISKILRHYEDEGMVQVTPLTLSGGQPNVPGFQHLYLQKKTNHKRQNEIIPYNDCLYKNLYLYDFIALLDIDEIIMPKYDLNWHDLMKRVMPKSKKLRNETYPSYNVRNVYFLDEHQHEHGWYKNIPKYLHMLQHVHRAQNYTKPNQYVKCFHNPEKVLTLHNHFPLSCLGGVCQSFPISTEDAQLQHYRADCVKTLKKSCGEFREHSIEDTSIWRFKDQLISRSVKTLEKLGFLRSSTKTTLARHFHIGPDYNKRTHIYSALSKYNGNGSIRLTTSMPNANRLTQSMEPHIQKIESNLSILQSEPISEKKVTNPVASSQRERCVSVTSQSTLITSLSRSDVLASTTNFGDKLPTNNKRNSYNNNHHQSTLSTIAEKLRRGTRKVLLFRTSPNNSTPQSPVTKEAAKLKKGNSVDSAHTNTISNSSLQEVDAEEFDSAELTKFMGEINNEIR